MSQKYIKEMIIKKENESETFNMLYESLKSATSPLDFIEESFEEIVDDILISKVNSNCFLISVPREESE